MLELAEKLPPSGTRAEFLPTTVYQPCIDTINNFNLANPLGPTSKTSTTDLTDIVTNFKELSNEVDDLKRYFNELGEADFKNSCDSDGFWKDADQLCKAAAIL